MFSHLNADDDNDDDSTHTQKRDINKGYNAKCAMNKIYEEIKRKFFFVKRKEKKWRMNFGGKSSVNSKK